MRKLNMSVCAGGTRQSIIDRMSQHVGNQARMVGRSRRDAS